MSRKLYVVVAESIADLPDRTSACKIARDLCFKFMQDSERFNRDKFYAACNLDEDGFPL